ncbi:hypothetical protein [Paenibacillus ginsengihumi]|uniref:hypothetical protein n=1 Tax=Paenibacillus ginsengihumi TaxID=431596 RepID=UPI000381D2BC|nr:hypothetical protein [Paenibacillus ginsengihumi]
MKANKVICAAFLLIAAGVAGGCGTRQTHDEGGTFAAAQEQLPAEPVQAASSAAPGLLAASEAAGQSPKGASQAAGSGNAAEAQARPDAQAVPAAAAQAAPAADAASQESAAPPASAAEEAPPKSSALPAAAAGAASAAASAHAGAAPPGSEQAAAALPQEAAKPDGAAAENSSAQANHAGHPVIKWSEFFDDDMQIAPSSKFWDLSEQQKTVEIKGFMGEVLSFEKRWFLLIPEPGAECPFDNGDETYWNKIMIVFVPNETKLRYTSGPLKVTGRLDVGIKVDESGYKTMFRLYDASFEKIKE